MSMDKLIVEAQECVEREYGRAGAKFGLTNNSDHESYAVLLEEMQEAQDESLSAEQTLNYLWKLIKRNAPDNKKYELLKNLETRALLAACEFIQVAAMAKKAAITVCDRASVQVFKEEGETT